ncbi:hypothetical protein ONO86_03814 [Micromonospora noduli]|nr:hypothetical protein ONO86_03814 [Micromonospora noduli]
MVHRVGRVRPGPGAPHRRGRHRRDGPVLPGPTRDPALVQPVRQRLVGPRRAARPAACHPRLDGDGDRPAGCRHRLPGVVVAVARRRRRSGALPGPGRRRQAAPAHPGGEQPGRRDHHPVRRLHRLPAGRPASRPAVGDQAAVPGAGRRAGGTGGPDRRDPAGHRLPLPPWALRRRRAGVRRLRHGRADRRRVVRGPRVGRRGGRREPGHLARAVPATGHHEDLVPHRRPGRPVRRVVRRSAPAHRGAAGRSLRRGAAGEPASVAWPAAAAGGVLVRRECRAGAPVRGGRADVPGAAAGRARVRRCRAGGGQPLLRPRAGRAPDQPPAQPGPRPVRHRGRGRRGGLRSHHARPGAARRGDRRTAAPSRHVRRAAVHPGHRRDAAGAGVPDPRRVRGPRVRTDRAGPGRPTVHPRRTARRVRRGHPDRVRSGGRRGQRATAVAVPVTGTVLGQRADAAAGRAVGQPGAGAPDVPARVHPGRAGRRLRHGGDRRGPGRRRLRAPRRRPGLVDPLRRDALSRRSGRALLPVRRGPGRAGHGDGGHLRRLPPAHRAGDHRPGDLVGHHRCQRLPGARPEPRHRPERAAPRGALRRVGQGGGLGAARPARRRGRRHARRSDVDVHLRPVQLAGQRSARVQPGPAPGTARPNQLALVGELRVQHRHRWGGDHQVAGASGQGPGGG